MKKVVAMGVELDEGELKKFVEAKGLDLPETDFYKKGNDLEVEFYAKTKEEVPEIIDEFTKDLGEEKIFKKTKDREEFKGFSYSEYTKGEEILVIWLHF
jgi:Zn-finger nucleic acid-binding protein